MKTKLSVFKWRESLWDLVRYDKQVHEFNDKRPTYRTGIRHRSHKKKSVIVYCPSGFDYLIENGLPAVFDTIRYLQDW